MDSSGLVSALTSSEGTMTVGVRSRPESRGISGGGETDGASCGGGEVDRAALIGDSAREKPEMAQYTRTRTSLNRGLEEPQPDRVLFSSATEVL